MMRSGIISAVVVGKILDKTRLFKECAVVLTTCNAISMIIFTWSLKSGNILYVYGAAFLIGVFVMGYYSCGMQLGIELTFPVHEEISTAISFLSAAFFAFVITVSYGYSIKAYGDLWSTIGMCVLCLIDVLATLCIRVDLKRQRAENEPIPMASELKEFI